MMKRFYKLIFVLSIALNGILLIYFGPRIVHRIFIDENNGSSTTNNDYWMERDEYFDMLSIDSNSIVFLGTSLTHNFEIHESIGGKDLKNRGINGDDLKGMINRVDNMLKRSPRKIFIEAGINDIGSKKLTSDETFQNYVELIDKIRTLSPTTSIYIQSIFPVLNESVSMPNYCSSHMNSLIIQINEKLRKYSSLNDKIQYIDLHKCFVLNKELNSKYTVDGVHLNGSGYQKWGEQISKYL